MDTTSLIPVRVGACLCPGTPHTDGDFVSVPPKPGLTAGVILSDILQAWVNARREDRPEQARMRAMLTEHYVLLGTREWNLVDEKGPIPVTAQTIATHLLDDFDRARLVADQVDDLWSEVLLRPLRELAQKSSPATSTNGSTSATRNGSPKNRKRSRRSLTSISPTDATETTSPVLPGASSS